jgi:hypothetical protein
MCFVDVLQAFGFAHVQLFPESLEMLGQLDVAQAFQNIVIEGRRSGLLGLDLGFVGLLVLWWSPGFGFGAVNPSNRDLRSSEEERELLLHGAVERA